MKNKNTSSIINNLNADVRISLVRMRAYNSEGGDMGYFALIAPCLKKAFKLFEIGYGWDLFSKPYICGMMNAAFKHAAADIAMNWFIYDENKVEYEEYLGWVAEKERELDALDLCDFEDWCEAMREYVDGAGGMAPGHRQVYIEIKHLIGVTA